MKWLLAHLLLHCALIYLSVEGYSCLQGTMNPMNRRRSKVKEVRCDFRKESCMTQMVARFEEVVSVERSCVQTRACRINSLGNIPKCYDGLNDIRLCFFCCQERNCNNATEIPAYTRGK